MKFWPVLCALLITQASRGTAFCPESALAPLQFVLEYAVWRGWQQAIVYTPDLEQGINYFLFTSVGIQLRSSLV